MREDWQELPSPVVSSRAFAHFRRKSTVIVSQDPVGPGGELRWHLSLACRDRLPSFEELRDARYEFVPDNVTMAMLFPPKREYVNAHENCLHLYEFVGNEIIT